MDGEREDEIDGSLSLKVDMIVTMAGFVFTPCSVPLNTSYSAGNWGTRLRLFRYLRCFD